MHGSNQIKYHTYIYIPTPPYARIYKYIYIFTYISTHTHTHIHTYIYIHTHIHIHIYTYIYTMMKYTMIILLRMGRKQINTKVPYLDLSSESNSQVEMESYYLLEK